MTQIILLEIEWFMVVQSDVDHIRQIDLSTAIYNIGVDSFDSNIEYKKQLSFIVHMDAELSA